VLVNGIDQSFQHLAGPGNLDSSHDRLGHNNGASLFVLHGAGPSFKIVHSKHCLLPSNQYAYMSRKPYALFMT
jgi:hypothetical protein